jgi:hypothetical protein
MTMLISKRSDHIDAVVQFLATNSRKLVEPTAINITEQYSLGVAVQLGCQRNEGLNHVASTVSVEKDRDRRQS